MARYVLFVGRVEEGDGVGRAAFRSCSIQNQGQGLRLSAEVCGENCDGTRAERESCLKALMQC